MALVQELFELLEQQAARRGTDAGAVSAAPGRDEPYRWWPTATASARY
ncbi:MAG: hypothetical protein WKG07_07115 [Hymenobacter sp.]